MSNKPLFSNTLELLDSPPAKSQVVCDALTKLFGLAYEVRFYDPTETAFRLALKLPSQEEEGADPGDDIIEEINAHAEYDVLLCINPGKVPAGLDQTQTTVFQTAANAIKSLQTVMAEQEEQYRDWNHLVSEMQGFWMVGRKHLLTVDEPIAAWDFKQCFISAISLSDAGENELHVNIYFRAIVQDKAGEAPLHWSADVPSPFSS